MSMEKNRTLNFLEDLTIRISFTYFLFDSIMSIPKGLLDREMIIHHVFALGIAIYGLYLGNMGFEIMMGLFLGESSNPFLVMKNNFTYLGRPNDSNTAGYGFMSTFLIMRGIFVPFFMWGIQMSSESSLIMKIYTGVIWWVSLIWIWKVTNLGTKELAKVIFFDYRIASP